ncbi:MAG: hypothetical protein ACK559_39400, partial [bacterium]
MPRHTLAGRRAINGHHHCTIRQSHIRRLHRTPVVRHNAQFIGQIRPGRRDHEPPAQSLRHRLRHRAG